MHHRMWDGSSVGACTLVCCVRASLWHLLVSDVCRHFAIHTHELNLCIPSCKKVKHAAILTVLLNKSYQQGCVISIAIKIRVGAINAMHAFMCCLFLTLSADDKDKGGFYDEGQFDQPDEVWLYFRDRTSPVSSMWSSLRISWWEHDAWDPAWVLHNHAESVVDLCAKAALLRFLKNVCYFSKIWA